MNLCFSICFRLQPNLPFCRSPFPRGLFLARPATLLLRLAVTASGCRIGFRRHRRRCALLYPRFAFTALPAFPPTPLPRLSPAWRRGLPRFLLDPRVIVHKHVVLGPFG